MSMINAPLIERELFFDNPKISGAQLSPDGNYITFIQPLDGMMNIWIKSIDDAFENATPLTDDKKRPIRSYFWSRDSKYVLYVQDKGGDENFRVYRVDPTEAKKDTIPDAKDLTPYEDIRAMIVSLPRSQEDKIFIGINDRDKAWHDFYSVNIEDGQRELILKNEEQLNGVTFNLEGNLRLGSRSLSDGGNEILEYRNGTFNRILTSNLEESCNPVRFDKNGKVYFISNVGKPDLAGLYLYDLEAGSMELIESDPENQVDLENLSFSMQTQELIATVYVGDKKRIYWKNADFEADYNYLKEQFPNSEISITSTTKDELKWIIYVSSDTDPGLAFLFDRKSQRIEFLYSPRPDLPTEHLVNMDCVRYKSSDGLEIPAYLTVPKVDKKENLPAILFIHGGPWARDYWGYNSYAQFLANRGYVVLQPNFRGSTGYGKKFLNAAINEWGEKMQDDITTGAQYLIDNKIADPNKIAIMGGSYGGYATLAGLTFTPDVYAAGVSIVGPSNLFTLLETIPPYWESARVMFHKRMGDPNTEEGKAQLKRQSPFFHASNIKAPLLVAQGANDPRVKKSESDQIVIAMRDHNLPVEYLNFPDEGHGFANPQNNMAFIVVMEKFLAKHLGGRCQEGTSDNLKSIIQNVTVNIDEVVMPEVLSEEEKNTKLPTAKTPIDSEIRYDFFFSMQGQTMAFEVLRSIKREGDHLIIMDTASSAMGDMKDENTVRFDTFQGIKRHLLQEPTELNLSIDGHHLTGQMTMQGNKQEIDIHAEKDFILDGPVLDTYLAHLPLSDDYKTLLTIFDSRAHKFQTFRFVVEDKENIDSTLCYRCLLSSVDGIEKSQTLWISRSDHPLLIKKSFVIPEMGGAKMEVIFKNIVS